MKVGKAVSIAGLSLLALCVLGAAVVKWRGFRASSTPPAFEAAVARSLRDFAIPHAESRKTNPVVDDPVALQQGRDAFLARCASCHGVDGRGSPAIHAMTGCTSGKEGISPLLQCDRIIY